MSRLQSVLRAAARLVLGLPGRAPVSAAMHDTLHWLSFPTVCHVQVMSAVELTVRAFVTVNLLIERF